MFVAVALDYAAQVLVYGYYYVFVRVEQVANKQFPQVCCVFIILPQLEGFMKLPCYADPYGSALLFTKSQVKLLKIYIERVLIFHV